MNTWLWTALGIGYLLFLLTMWSCFAINKGEPK